MTTEKPVVLGKRSDQPKRYPVICAPAPVLAGPLTLAIGWLLGLFDFD